jgi:hypothetical protein
VAAVVQKAAAAGTWMCDGGSLCRMVDRGEVRDYADPARLGFITRARMTQIMNLLNLARNIQEGILESDAGEAATKRLCERHLRTITSLGLWKDQRFRWRLGLAHARVP